MTHDQSFPGPSGHSVNSRVIRESLPPCMNSFVLSRTIHYIMNLCPHYPSTRIFSFDLDAAYKCCHLSAATAAESITIFDGLLLMALRMTFGGTPCPSLWGCISDTITDVSNALICNALWDHSSLFDEISDSLDAPRLMDDDVPFHPAKPLAVNIPTNDMGKVDIYIAKCILGWEINTRSISISLPPNKHRNWSAQIAIILSSKRVSSKELEILIGRLNHCASILPPMRYFLGRLRFTLLRSSKSNWTTLSLSEKSDLYLMQNFLDYAKNGVSMNTIVFRKPTHIFRSDASEFGLGGYKLTSGKAWRFELLVDCRLKSSLNSLEILACTITIWIDAISDKNEDEACILSQTDSTTAAGWLHKSNFAEVEDKIMQMTTARHLVSLLINTKSCLYSQWFLGSDNIVTDSLSRDFHIDSNTLSHLICSSVPEQVTFGLEILTLPEEISSWLTCLLQNQPCKMQWSKEPMQSRLVLGFASISTLHQSDTSMTHASRVYPEPNDTESSPLLPTQSERVDTALKITQNSNQSQSEPPWIAWHIPLSWLTSQTQDWTEKISLPSFYSANSEVMPTLTNQ